MTDDINDTLEYLRDESNDGHDVSLTNSQARLLWSYIDRLTGRCAALAALRYGEPRSAGIPTPASTCDVMPATMEGLRGPRCQCGKYEWLPDTRSIRDGAGVYHWHDAPCRRPADIEHHECGCPICALRNSKVDGGV